jgi:hypothetical protein
MKLVSKIKVYKQKRVRHLRIYSGCFDAGPCEKIQLMVAMARQRKDTGARKFYGVQFASLQHNALGKLYGWLNSCLEHGTANKVFGLTWSVSREFGAN